MKNKKLSVNSVVYSKIGVGVIVRCLDGFFGDSETVYEVKYDGYGTKLSRFKEFTECI